MLFDEQELFSKAQNFTANGNSTNVLSYTPDSNIGIGEPLVVCIALTAKPDDTSANETYLVELQVDDAEGMGSPVVIGSVNIPRAAKAGDIFTIDIPPTLVDEAFHRLAVTVGGTTPSISFTAGRIWRKMVQAFTTYANAYTP